jgi:3-oxoacyl-[acyl-carrier protein] reductase
MMAVCHARPFGGVQNNPRTSAPSSVTMRTASRPISTPGSSSGRGQNPKPSGRAFPRNGSLIPDSLPRISAQRSVAGKVVLVTGAASGMGRATARVFSDEGAVVAATDVNAEGLEGDATWALDVADPDAIVAVVDEAVDRLGPIDILVNNAGISLPVPIEADDYFRAWDATIAVNLSAYVRLVRACLPHLVRDRAGRIVNIASTEGLGATPYVSPYTVSKHGVVGLTRSLACELGPQGVTVNCICPGPIRTGMTALIPDDAKDRFARRRVPLRRYGEPEEVAHMVLSLALPAASFVNGAVLTVDGGLTAKFG